MNLFFIFCALLIACAVFVVQCNNPVYAVLFLILAFFNASALTLLAGHDYLAALLIVLYVGATCTFFLFAIMILNIQIAEISEKRLKLAPISAVVGIILALILENVITSFESPINYKSDYDYLITNSYCGPEQIRFLIDTSTQIYSLGTILYTHYGYLLILASLILMSAMIGSISLTLTKGTGNLRQVVFEQNIRSFKTSIRKHS